MASTPMKTMVSIAIYCERSEQNFLNTFYLSKQGFESVFTQKLIFFSNSLGGGGWPPFSGWGAMAILPPPLDPPVTPSIAYT